MSLASVLKVSLNTWTTLSDLPDMTARRVWLYRIGIAAPLATRGLVCRHRLWTRLVLHSVLLAVLGKLAVKD